MDISGTFPFQCGSPQLDSTQLSAFPLQFLCLTSEWARSLWIAPSGSLDGQKLEHGLGLGVSVYFIDRNSGFGQQEVSHPGEQMGRKCSKKALVPGAITSWKTLDTNKWSSCSMSWPSRVHPSYSALKRCHHFTFGRHFNNRASFIWKFRQYQNTQRQESSTSFIKAMILWRVK